VSSAGGLLSRTYVCRMHTTLIYGILRMDKLDKRHGVHWSCMVEESKGFCCVWVAGCNGLVRSFRIGD
jgi:hypothetical protein